jgi:hypothetical protein
MCRRAPPIDTLFASAGRSGDRDLNSGETEP